ncbi:deoxyuridine 5'-triphosphate nucleotidohydrolase isoform X5 [Rattus norvegicus]|uniref:Deoxyuridine 5'-triphosphate nucleotidohydrolase n=1 Tax=Rattus norvegicus TaxID=10116 RepID=A0ABK0M2K9_RAT
MPLLCALLRSRLQPSLLRSLTLTSAQSLSCGGSRGVRTWSARTGPGACADPAVSVSKRARAEDDASLRFVRLSEHATAPTRGSARAAGYDLYSAYDYTIPSMEKALVKTDIQIAVPSGCYGRVAPRSGLAVKHFIDVGDSLAIGLLGCTSKVFHGGKFPAFCDHSFQHGTTCSVLRTCLVKCKRHHLQSTSLQRV